MVRCCCGALLARSLGEGRSVSYFSWPSAGEAPQPPQHGCVKYKDRRSCGTIVRPLVANTSCVRVLLQTLTPNATPSRVILYEI